MFESSITVKGQTTIPRAVRDSLEVKAGDKVRYVIVDEGVLIMPVRPMSRLFRSLKHDGPAVSLEEMDRARRRRGNRPMEAVDANVVLRYLVGDNPE